MPDLRDRLIEIYNGRTADEAAESPEFQELCREQGGSRQFMTLQLEVERARRELFQLLEEQSTYRAQVKIGIKRLQGFRRNGDKFRLYDSLLHGNYYPRWNQSQKEHFDWASKVIRGEKQYFLSFTNRKPDGGPQDSHNTINDEYLLFIARILYDRPVPDLDLSRNLVAEAVKRYLSRKLRGFYYPDHEGDNRSVSEKLRSASETSLTFVQLIQGVMFELDEENYCQLEYQLALKDPNRRIFFVFLDKREDLLRTRPATMSNHGWFESATTVQDAVHLDPTDDDNEAAVKKNKELLREKVITPILDAVNSVFENVPSD